jgi:hypothetical protein
LAISVLVGLGAKLAWSYWTAPPVAASLAAVNQIGDWPKPARRPDSQRDVGAGKRSGSASSDPSEKHSISPAHRNVSVGHKDVPAAMKPLRLRSIPPQTVEVGQPLRVAISVEDAADWKGKVRFSLADSRPPGTKLDPATGLFTWTPPDDFPPETHYIFVWADGVDGQWDVMILEVAVTAAPDDDKDDAGQPDSPLRPLRLKPIGLKTVRAGGTLTFSAVIEDAEYWKRQGTVRFRFEPGDGPDLPHRAHLNPTTGLFTWNAPLLQPAGVYDFKLSVAGPRHQTAQQTFTIHVFPADWNAWRRGKL